MKLFSFVRNVLSLSGIIFIWSCNDTTHPANISKDNEIKDTTTIKIEDNTNLPADTATHKPAACCIHFALDKMNTIYKGIDHRFFVTANAGATVSASNATLISGSKEGEYSISATEGDEATVTVKDKDCEQTFNLRVKKLPDPVIYFGTIKGSGLMTKAELMSQNGIFARMENSDFDVRFRVVS